MGRNEADPRNIRQEPRIMMTSMSSRILPCLGTLDNADTQGWAVHGYYMKMNESFSIFQTEVTHITPPAGREGTVQKTWKPSSLNGMLCMDCWPEPKYAQLKNEERNKPHVWWIGGERLRQIFQDQVMTSRKKNAVIGWPEWPVHSFILRASP